MKCNRISRDTKKLLSVTRAEWTPDTYMYVQRFLSTVVIVPAGPSLHNENTPIQIYWEFYDQKKKKKNENFQMKNSGSFHISAQNIDCR